MDMKLMLDENFIWASLIWSGIAGGYLIYGWRQKASIPLAAGAAMTAMSSLARIDGDVVRVHRHYVLCYWMVWWFGGVGLVVGGVGGMVCVCGGMVI